MNVSITDCPAGVKSGPYNHASEVVREALRRMEDEDAIALRLAKPLPRIFFPTGQGSKSPPSASVYGQASIRSQPAGTGNIRGAKGLKRLRGWRMR